MGTLTKAYSAKSDSALQKAINRFAGAVHNKAFQGTIPRGESHAAAEAYEAINDEFVASRDYLERLIERRAV